MYRIVRVEIRNHPALGEIEADLVKAYDGDGSPVDDLRVQPAGDLRRPYISVIIGRNGSGKSLLLQAVVEIVRYMEALNDARRDGTATPAPPPFDFKVYVQYGTGNILEIDRKSLIGGRLHKDRRPNRLPLPERLIASTSMALDKFPARSGGCYRYCGIRNPNTPGLVSTRALVRRTVGWLLESLVNKMGFADEISDLLGQLGLQPHLTLSYSVRYREVFLRRDMSPELLLKIFNNQKKYFPRRNRDLWGTSEFRKLEQHPERLADVAAFLSRTAEEYPQSGHVTIKYGLPDKDWQRAVRDRDALEVLSKIGILSFPTLRVYKEERDGFSFSEASSGETAILCQMLSIMSNIRPDSVVLVDEPEQSAHPNWQISYITWLNRIFRNYPTCQFIISTHSHFMLSDLDPESGTLVALERRHDEAGAARILDNGMEMPPYCWGTDDILYRVFRVRNTRNRVFEGRMMDLYRLMQSADPDREALCRLIEELSAYRLNADDPLLRLLREAESRVKG